VKSALGVITVALVMTACGAGQPAPSPSPSGLGAELKAMELDINTMREATAAADDVIRASGDCDAARPLIAAANARLDETQRKLQTATGKQTLEALRKKVRDVAESCG
jgi:outer membrane murein-binding lipoprotein Lpp